MRLMGLLEGMEIWNFVFFVIFWPVFWSLYKEITKNPFADRWVQPCLLVCVLFVSNCFIGFIVAKIQTVLVKRFAWETINSSRGHRTESGGIMRNLEKEWENFLAVWNLMPKYVSLVVYVVLYWCWILLRFIIWKYL